MFKMHHYMLVNFGHTGVVILHVAGCLIFSVAVFALIDAVKSGLNRERVKQQNLIDDAASSRQRITQPEDWIPLTERKRQLADARRDQKEMLESELKLCG